MTSAFAVPGSIAHISTNKISTSKRPPICQWRADHSASTASTSRERTTSHLQQTPNPVSRRHALHLLATLAAMSSLPHQADALSKKRIMSKAGPEFSLPSGITYRDITVGKGYVPRNGDTVAIHYSLFFKDLEVESSRESQGLAASPLGFTFGTESGPGSIIPGINLGMDGMKVGGLRLITVPAQYAFGEKGKLPLIPPNSTVEFAVSLLSCKRAGTNPNSIINPNAQAY